MSNNHNRWVVLQVTQRQERWVRDELQEQGVDAYVPLHITAAPKAKRKQTRTRALMPGYVFARLPDDESIDIALALRPVRAILCRDGKPLRVSPLAIGSMILFEACHAFDETWQPPPVKGRRYSHRWKRGDRVKIEGTAFDGFIAQVLRGRGRDQMEVLLTLFGRPTEVVVPHRQLVKAAPDALAA